MPQLDDAFAAAADLAKQLKERPDNETLLKLYALYKQGSQGDVSGKRPGFTNFVGRAKFDAWQQLKGVPQEEAKQQYIDLVNALSAAES
jgi:acyl-CoA-binding protein